MRAGIFFLFLFISSIVLAQEKPIEIYKEAVQNYKDGNIEGAVKNFDKVIKESEHSELLKMSYVFKSQCQSILGDYKKSLNSIDKAIELDPEDAATYFDKIHVLEEIEEFDYIITICNILMKMDLDQHNKAFTYFYLGKANLELENYAEAISFLSKGIDFNQADYSSFYYRGIAYEMDDKPKKAIQDYSKAIELSPEFGYAYARRGLAKVNEIIVENEGTYVSVFGKSACSDLHKAKELGIDVEDLRNVYCNSVSFFLILIIPYLYIEQLQI